jgi:hypothetical protein
MVASYPLLAYVKPMCPSTPVAVRLTFFLNPYPVVFDHKCPGLSKSARQSFLSTSKSLDNLPKLVIK